MSPFNVKELDRRNRALHEQHLRQLKRSIATRGYHVSPNQVASSIIREARTGHSR